MPIIYERQGFRVGDLVHLRGSRREERYCIIDFKHNERQEIIAVLKALFNETILIEKNIAQLESLHTRGLL